MTCKTLDLEMLQRNIMIKCQVSVTSHKIYRRSPRNEDIKRIKI